MSSILCMEVLIILCSVQEDIVEYGGWWGVANLEGGKAQRVGGPSPALSELNAGPK